MPGFLIYGANGYTGTLIAREAVARGHRLVLAGRNAEALATLAGDLGLGSRIFALDDPSRVAARNRRTFEPIFRCGRESL